MFIPNEIITEILNIADYQTWINKIKEVNKLYHSLLRYHDGLHQALDDRHRFVANWRKNGFYTNDDTENYIYPMNIETHQANYAPNKKTLFSQIKLPHNY